MAKRKVKVQTPEEPQRAAEADLRRKAAQRKAAEICLRAPVLIGHERPVHAETLESARYFGTRDRHIAACFWLYNGAPPEDVVAFMTGDSNRLLAAFWMGLRGTLNSLPSDYEGTIEDLVKRKQMAPNFAQVFYGEPSRKVDVWSLERLREFNDKLEALAGGDDG